MEAYQRTQALVLLDDMREPASPRTRGIAADYVTASPLGAGATCPVVGGSPTRQEIDAAEWCNALQGAAEISGANKIGAMIGGRGCVESLPDNEYLITVAWQGITPIQAPPAGLSCAKDLDDGATGSTCTADRRRRTVTTIVRIATLNWRMTVAKPPHSGDARLDARLHACGAARRDDDFARDSRGAGELFREPVRQPSRDGEDERRHRERPLRHAGVPG